MSEETEKPKVVMNVGIVKKVDRINYELIVETEDGEYIVATEITPLPKAGDAVYFSGIQVDEKRVMARMNVVPIKPACIEVLKRSLQEIPELIKTSEDMVREMYPEMVLGGEEE